MLYISTHFVHHNDFRTNSFTFLFYFELFFYVVLCLCCLIVVLFSRMTTAQMISQNQRVKILTSSILVAEVWEPPHVAQAHAEAHLCQHVLEFRVPCWPILVVCLSSIWTGRRCKLRFRLAVTQPVSLLVQGQWRLLRLVIVR